MDFESVMSKSGDKPRDKERKNSRIVVGSDGVAREETFEEEERQGKRRIVDGSEWLKGVEKATGVDLTK